MITWTHEKYIRLRIITSRDLIICLQIRGCSYTVRFSWYVYLFNFFNTIMRSLIFSLFIRLAIIYSTDNRYWWTIKWLSHHYTIIKNLGNCKEKLLYFYHYKVQPLLVNDFISPGKIVTIFLYRCRYSIQSMYKTSLAGTRYVFYMN